VADQGQLSSDDTQSQTPLRWNWRYGTIWVMSSGWMGGIQGALLLIYFDVLVEDNTTYAWTRTRQDPRLWGRRA
jgi:hypothetical protein